MLVVRLIETGLRSVAFVEDNKPAETFKVYFENPFNELLGCTTTTLSFFCIVTLIGTAVLLLSTREKFELILALSKTDENENLTTGFTFKAV